MTFCVSLSPLSASAEVAEEVRSVAGFHAVSAAIAGRISLSRGDAETLVIEAEPDTLDRILTEVEDGVLRIHEKSETSWWRDSGPIRIRITYRQLEGLELSGSADVSTDALAAETFRVGISGSSNVDIPSLQAQTLRIQVTGSGDLEARDLSVATVEVGVSGSGDVQLTGLAETLSVAVNGSGNVDCATLEADRADVEVRGSGDVEVWVQEDLDVRISGSGNVAYLGEPALRSSISGSGDLERR